MKYSIIFGFVFLIQNLFGQSNQTTRLFFPFLDKESQSNITVVVSDFGGGGLPCPPEYTNSLSNTNIFTKEEEKTIDEVFTKYKDVATNSGPTGTRLISLYKTNYIVGAMNKMFTNENWVANFQYTNSEAYEEIRFGSGIFAKFKNKSNDGYGASFTRTGSGALLNFWEIKHGSPDGLLVRFDGFYVKDLTFNYNVADFTNNSLVEYRRYTNGLITGKFFMWNAISGNLTLEANFKEPYDFEKHRIDQKLIQQMIHH